MVIVLALLGIAALVLGAGMAIKPTQRRYEGLRPITVAMIFGALCVSLTGLTNMFVGASRNVWEPKFVPVLFGGLAEMLVPTLAVFGVLTIAWGLAAIGLRRLD
jgi:hypothetical protein